MKEVFVFGAGASAASAGIPFPLGKELVWTYFQDCRDFSEVDGNGQATSEDRRKKLEHFNDLLKFLKSRPEFKEYANQLERMVNTTLTHDFNVSKEHYIDELMYILQKENNQGIVRLIKCLAVKHIIELSLDAPNKLYKTFVQRLIGKSILDVSIISFNFDCLLEQASKNILYLDDLLDFQTIAGTRQLSYQKGRGIPLIKLHGSMDWAFNSEVNKINLNYLPVRADKYYLQDGSQRNSKEPYIFLPYQQIGELMKPLRDRAKQALKHADKITIIGYSFPGHDQKEMIELFENVSSKAEWEVIDYVEGDFDFEKKNEVREKYKKLFPNIGTEKIKFDFNGFQGYMSHNCCKV